MRLATTYFIRTGLFSLLIIMSLGAYGQPQIYKAIDTKEFDDAAHHWYDIFDKENVIMPKKNQPRFNPADITHIADNILLYQKDNGGWPKNYDILAILSPEQEDSLRGVQRITTNTTFDNGTSWTHVTYLAQAYTETQIERYKAACIKGLEFIMAAQYGNGGWPQYFPLEKDYSRFITYNDGVFAGIIGVLKKIADNNSSYSFIDAPLRKKLIAAYKKGIACILNTQINDTGTPTVWCQQHDEKTLAPAWARAFEPPSICNGESADIVLLLMSIKNPDSKIMDAVQNAVAWFEKSQILNTRIKTIIAPADTSKYRISKTDKIVVEDNTGPPIWTRYYELKTHRPMFCNRDRTIVYSLAEVKRERRDGYGWYTYAPQKVLDHYKEWLKVNSITSVLH
ncbi:MAG: pectate lyase [Chitinophagaceae bacterium]